MADYDFAGWATKYDVLCSDGTTIKPGCFDEQDGERVPLIWMHNHNDVGQVLGHALLQKRPEGMYAYGKFNDTPAGQYAKSLIKNGDVNSLSIFANHLKRAGKNLNDIVHGKNKRAFSGYWWFRSNGKSRLGS
jgi:HK97 family phage prohead protease